MNLKSTITLVLTLLFLAVGSQAQATQTTLWTVQYTDDTETLEDIIILKRNVPLSQADHNDRLVALMTVQLPTSGPGNSFSRIRIYDAGTGAVLNQADMPQPDYKAYKLENVGHINNDRTEDFIVRTRNANGTYNFVYETNGLTFLGASLTLQNDLDSSNNTGHERPRLVWGDFDKDGVFNYGIIETKGVGIFDRISIYNVQ